MLAEVFRDGRAFSHPRSTNTCLESDFPPRPIEIRWEWQGPYCVQVHDLMRNQPISLALLLGEPWYDIIAAPCETAPEVPSGYASLASLDRLPSR